MRRPARSYFSRPSSRGQRRCAVKLTFHSGAARSSRTRSSATHERHRHRFDVDPHADLHSDLHSDPHHSRPPAVGRMQRGAHGGEQLGWCFQAAVTVTAGSSAISNGRPPSPCPRVLDREPVVRDLVGSASPYTVTDAGYNGAWLPGSRRATLHRDRVGAVSRDAALLYQLNS